jgi:NDP-sugar pyrophosphorylase family protein
MGYRQLTRSEIKLLELQYCYCEDWDKVLVTEHFSPEKVRNVSFSGEVKIGDLSGSIETGDGSKKSGGIDHAFISNTTIGNNVRISHVNNLSNYIIEDDVVIENVSELSVTGLTNFGNGSKLDILNEGGGRTLTIFDRLTSQIAYLQVCYRHDAQFQTRLQEVIDRYVQTKRALMGLIRRGARVYDCILLKNLIVGESVTLNGAFSLEDGTILGSSSNPSVVGVGVVAKHFIILEGSQVDSGAILDKCFVGQGVRLGKQFSAENSAFFANCEGFHGEAVSLFAGPYTVTHHKSTLLIGVMTSFFNAGSGTNQSNHMYKIGPVHQGILERGVKTGSFSYLLWPGRVGAFSVIIGKHYNNLDISDLPFSYVFESEGNSVLYPGKNLFTGGTRRDTLKWASRDRRKGNSKLDLIHFDFRGPYIVNKMLRAIEILRELDAKAPADQKYAAFQGVVIKRNQLANYIANYEMAIKICIGFAVVNRFETKLDQTTNIQFADLVQSDKSMYPKWLDISGLYAPQAVLEQVMMAVKNGQLDSVSAISEELHQIYEAYPDYSWQYFLCLIRQQTGTDNLTPAHFQQIIADWKAETTKLDRAILKDLYKEFDQSSRIGYGIDGDTAVRDADFYAVRGSYEEHDVIQRLEQEIVEIDQRANRLISILANLN